MKNLYEKEFYLNERRIILISGKEEKLIEILGLDIYEALLKLRNIKIDLVGSWVWVRIKNYKYAKKLKDMGFNFNKQKEAFSYHLGEFPYCKKTNNIQSLDELIREFT